MVSKMVVLATISIVSSAIIIGSTIGIRDYLNNSIVIMGEPDKFGITAIFSTKPDGREWFIDMNNPEGDGIFRTNSLLTKSDNGSWRVTGDHIRMYVDTPFGQKDWRDVEMTGYVKLVETIPGEINGLDYFSWFARGGLHNLSDPCKGSAYKNKVKYDGTSIYLVKELWHGGEDTGYSDRQNNVNNAIKPLNNRWIGIKMIMYNIDNDRVKTELYLDNNNDNDWKKITEAVDGNWPVHNPAPSNCINPLTGKPLKIDEIILWGGKTATFRADYATFDFKNLSVREIEVNEN